MTKPIGTNSIARSTRSLCSMSARPSLTRIRSSTAPKRIENLFGSEFAYLEGSTPWLKHVTDDVDAFERMLDVVEES